jgi:hypothetical protein
MPKKEDPLVRFHRSYEVDLETGCWLWTKAKCKGYGVFKINRKMIKAHRFSYETFVGPLDPNLEICHNCNCKSCINPQHLRQDTKSSNAIDRVKDFKQNGQILKSEQIIEIKIALQSPYWGINKDLAKKYQVHSSHITKIKNNDKWKHITIE